MTCLPCRARSVIWQCNGYSYKPKGNLGTCICRSNYSHGADAGDHNAQIRLFLSGYWRQIRHCGANLIQMQMPVSIARQRRQRLMNISQPAACALHQLGMR